MSRGASVWLAYGGALAIGGALVLSIFPPDVLLSGVRPDAYFPGDIAQHVAGQRAYLQDTWHWPLLRTTMLGWPRGVRIAMTDSIPLIALPLKLFARWLPPGFSAIQFWLVFADAMLPVAAVFALRSAGVTRLLPALAVAVLAVNLPSFLFGQGESALSSHFAILLAIGSYARTMRGAAGRRWLPPALQLGSFLIHPYLGFMVAGVLLAAPVSLAARRDRRWRAEAAVAACGLIAAAAAAACLGYAADPPTDGFGDYAMNALGPMYPALSAIFHVAPVIGSVGWPWAGYQYVGAGVLVIVLAGGACLGRREPVRLMRSHVGLVLACIAFTALALSNRVYVGHRLVIDFGHAPSLLQQLRISGRLFWPVSYLSIIVAVVLVDRVRSVWLRSVVLVTAGLLQFYDTNQFRFGLAAAMRHPVAEPYDPARLAELIGHHTHVTVLPTAGCGLQLAGQPFLQIVLAAATRRVTVNTMYMARLHDATPCDDGHAAARDLAPGELRFFLDDRAVAGPIVVPGHADVCRTLGPAAVCTLQTSLLHGLPVVAGPPAAWSPHAASVGALGIGWYQPDAEGVWSAGSQAFLALQANLSAAEASKLAVRAAVMSNIPQTSIEVLVDGVQVADHILNASPQTEDVEFPIQASYSHRTVLIEFRVPSPHGYGLGIYLRSAKVIPHQ